MKGGKGIVNFMVLNLAIKKDNNTFKGIGLKSRLGKKNKKR